MEKNLGHATAYGYAKSKGYTGTEEEFGVLMASYASVAQDASQSASSAAESAQLASNEAQRASQSATSAHNDAETASNIKTDVESARDTTVDAKNATVEAKNISVEAKNSAISAKDTAESKAQIAEAWAVGQKDGTDVPSTDETYHNNAKYYSEQADIAKIGAESAQQLAQASATSASESVSDASISAQTASQAAQTATSKASEATTAATIATTKASEASTSAGTASTAAQTATNKASEATTAATTATTKASEANQSATSASMAKINAETARDAAAQSASEAANSAIEAAQSAQSVDAERLNRVAFGSYVAESASGSIASFPDGADSIPMKDALVHIEPVQDLHGYDSPWPAGGGKNKLPYPFSETTKTVAGITFTDLGDGKIKVNGTATARAVFFYANHVFKPIPSGDYILSRNTTVSDVVIAIDAYNGDTLVKNIKTSGLTESPFSIDYDGYDRLDIFVYIAAGQTVSNDTISLMIRLATETDATYSPYSNICPITGWTGAKVTRTGKNLAQFTNGKSIGNTIETKTYDLPNRSSTLTPIKIVEGKQYKWYNSAGHPCIYAVWNGDTLIRRIVGIPSGTTLDTTGGNELYACGLDDESINVLPETCGVFFADEFDGFVPYHGETYNITFPTEAGTVYGGTLDVTKGELVVDRAYLTDDGSLDWTRNADGSFYIRNPGAPAIQDANGCICNYAPFNISFDGLNVFFRSNGLVNLGKAWGNLYASVEALKAAFSNVPIQFVYRLATPITYTLTPTEITSLLGENNVWADTGNSEVTYRVDPALLLDDELSEVQSMIAGVESSTVATKNYSIGDLVIVGDTLYEVTVAIASGETISASNTVVTTVENVIKNRMTTIDNTIRNRIADSIDDTLTQSGQAADSKAVGDEISDVKEDLNDVSTDLVNLSGGKQTISGVFSYGVFDSSNNMPETDPRKFNAVMMTAETYNRDITLTAKDGYNFLVYFYDANDDYVRKSARWESSRYVPKNTYFRLWVRPDPLDTSIVLDLDAVKQQIIFNVPIQDEIDDTVKSVALANANAELSGAGLQMIDTSFAYGTMNTHTGQAVSDTGYKYQVIMPTYATYDRNVTIKCNSGYRYQVWWYNEDDTYISRTASFRTDADEYTITAGTHFRLFVTLNPQDTSANVPVETFAENIFIRTKINDRVTAVETKPLSTLPEYILNTLSYKQVGVLSKGYILLSCDDGTAGLATYTIPMLINKNVPATFGLLMTSPVITDESYLETVIDAVENHGCCVAQHGSTQWTTLGEDALNKYFDETATAFNTAGIAEIHGAICPGGAVADTNALVQAVAGGRFKSLFSGGLQGEIKYGNYNAVGARTNMYAMARYSAIGFTQQTYQQAIDDAYDNHYILCPFWHDYSVVDDASKQAIIEGMIDYAKTKGLTFITMADLPTII